MALRQFESWVPDLVITDVKMPGQDGMALMARIREQRDDIGVVVMTAFGSAEHAMAVVRAGADDYLTKPVHFAELLVVVKRVLAHHALQRENGRLQARLEAQEVNRVDASALWIGESPAARALIARAGRVADSDVPVLILGESGTGMTRLARMMHSRSQRRGCNFVTVHCGALDGPSLVRVLGGGRRLVTAPPPPERWCDGGTLFLDEMDQASPTVQVELLRCLETGTLEYEGRSFRTDVRIIAATEQDLAGPVAEGRFREDLFYRLNAVTLEIPGLCERREDIPALAMHFLERGAIARGGGPAAFTDRALWVLAGHDWPGNVRQLKSCADAAMAELEKFAILKTLEHVRGSTSKAAKILGISPRKIQYRLTEYRETDPSGTPSVVRDQS